MPHACFLFCFSQSTTSLASFACTTGPFHDWHHWLTCTMGTQIRTSNDKITHPPLESVIRNLWVTFDYPIRYWIFSVWSTKFLTLHIYIYTGRTRNGDNSLEPYWFLLPSIRRPKVSLRWCGAMKIELNLLMEYLSVYPVPRSNWLNRVDMMEWGMLTVLRRTFPIPKKKIKLNEEVPNNKLGSINTHRYRITFDVEPLSKSVGSVSSTSPPFLKVCSPPWEFESRSKPAWWISHARIRVQVKFLNQL